MLSATDFYPRSPCGERPLIADVYMKTHEISIHALLAESDQWRRNATVLLAISIHALLAESDTSYGTTVSNIYISIHALLAESDCFCVYLFKFQPLISIHALLAESDAVAAQFYRAAGRDFYPRSPCGERRGRLLRSALDTDFYPRSPCGERPCPKSLLIAIL